MEGAAIGFEGRNVLFQMERMRDGYGVVEKVNVGFAYGSEIIDGFWRPIEGD